MSAMCLANVGEDVENWEIAYIAGEIVDYQSP